MNEDHYLTGRVIDGKIYVDNADLWPFLKRKNAEIERLRAALREIAEGDRPDNDEQFCVGYWGATARAALGEGKE